MYDRFEDIWQRVDKHEERLNGLDKDQIANHVLLKSVKEDTESIKESLKILSQHDKDIAIIKATTSMKRRLVEMAFGGGGIAAIILTVLALVKTL